MSETIGINLTTIPAIFNVEDVSDHTKSQLIDHIRALREAGRDLHQKLNTVEEHHQISVHDNTRLIKEAKAMDDDASDYQGRILQLQEQRNSYAAGSAKWKSLYIRESAGKQALLEAIAVMNGHQPPPFVFALDETTSGDLDD